MFQKARFQLALLFQLLLLSAPMISKAGQLLGVSPDNPDWSDWKGAPNFPGIKIRVLCGTYVQSTGNAQWSFQFQNAYSKQVYLVYQEEASDSTGAPPKFSTPGGRNLGPGKKSDVYTDYLPGTCESRKQIFIRIVSISDDQGNQTQARAGASRSGAFTAPPQSSSTAGNRSVATAQSTSSPGQSGQPQSMPNSVSQAAGLSVQPASSGVSGNVAGTTWGCQVDVVNSSPSANALRPAPVVSTSSVNFVATFAKDGTILKDGDKWGSHEGARWQQAGSSITFLLPKLSEDFNLKGTLQNLDLIAGQVVSDWEQRFGPGFHLGGSFRCNRKASTGSP